MTTGTDLVAWQIELARGNLHPFGQSRITASGHAIECRLYAENPAKHFMPSPGRLVRFRMPEPSDDVRVDTGFREGDEVTFHYDPLLAKIIVRGGDRDAAIDRMREALDSDIAEIKASLLLIKWMVGFVLAFVVALAWHTIT